MLGILSSVFKKAFSKDFGSNVCNPFLRLYDSSTIARSEKKSFAFPATAKTPFPISPIDAVIPVCSFPSAFVKSFLFLARWDASTGKKRADILKRSPAGSSGKLLPLLHISDLVDGSTYRTRPIIQYQHLFQLEGLLKGSQELASALGLDYLVRPDIVVIRSPVSDAEINRDRLVVEAEDSRTARLTPFRESNQKVSPPAWFLHASISCKWTIRSDRSQNTRTEALNLIRNRKGPLPHIVAVTAEPLPTRIASLALGTGEMDGVYHFALPELEETCRELDLQDQLEMLQTMIQGDRLRDISDLPLDLTI